VEYWRVTEDLRVGKNRRVEFVRPIARFQLFDRTLCATRS
jgi:hypothetical protein